MEGKREASARGRSRAEQVLLITLSSAWVALLYSAFNPLFHGDSGGYTVTGCAIWGPIPIRVWDGGRTPLYPALLSLLQHVASGTCVAEPAHRVLALVTVVQLVLWLASVAYLHRALASTGRLVRVGAVALVVLSPLHALFIRQILTEALAASLLNVFLAHLGRFVLQGRSRRDATLVFTSFTLLVLTRPQVLLPLLPIVAFVLWTGAERLRLLGRLALVTALPLVGLASFNQWNHRHFSLTTLDGYARTGVVYNIFDRVHPEDVVLGEIMSRQYRADLAAGGSDGLVFARAFDEIRRNIDHMPYRKRRGPASSDLNAYMGRVGTYLILENPGTVVRNTAASAVQFWNLGVLAVQFRSDGEARSPGLDRNIAHEGPYALYLLAQRADIALRRACILVLPFLLLAAALRRGPRSVALAALLYLTFVGNFVFVAIFNVVQARYVVLLQPLLMLSACLALEALLRERREAGKALPEEAAAA
jgi:hypothetical protein